MNDLRGQTEEDDRVVVRRLLHPRRLVRVVAVQSQHHGFLFINPRRNRVWDKEMFEPPLR